jgi:hypothetical protein
MALLVLALAGCAQTPPKIEGRVGTVSHDDIQNVIALVRRRMPQEWGRVLAVDRVEVRSHNEIVLICPERPHMEHWIVVRRIRGGWKCPSLREVVEE